jgi:GNAT superfamily N-acetyltransferase
MDSVRTLFAPACPARQWRVVALELGPGGPGAAELSRVLACQRAADLTDRPGEPGICPAELRGLLVPPYCGRRLLFTATDVTGHVVGWARLGLYEAFHRDVAHAALTVHPAVRRCGVGSMLFDALVWAARTWRRSRLIVDAPRTRASEAFASRHGLFVSGRDLRSRLDLDGPELSRRLVAAVNPAAANPGGLPRQRRRHARPGPGDGFATLCWSGPCPEEFLDGYVSTLDYLHTAEPSGPAGPAPAPDAAADPGSGSGVTPFTPAEVRHREQSARRAGLREYTACLIDQATGRIAALSSAHTPDGLRGEQNETVVAPDYRGLGLAVRVKAQLIRELLAAEPSLAMLDTYNAVDNFRMLAVNHRLGFRPLDTHAAWTLTL